MRDLTSILQTAVKTAAVQQTVSGAVDALPTAVSSDKTKPRPQQQRSVTDTLKNVGSKFEPAWNAVKSMVGGAAGAAQAAASRRAPAEQPASSFPGIKNPRQRQIAERLDRQLAERGRQGAQAEPAEQPERPAAEDPVREDAGQQPASREPAERPPIEGAADRGEVDLSASQPPAPSAEQNAQTLVQKHVAELPDGIETAVSGFKKSRAGQATMNQIAQELAMQEAQKAGIDPSANPEQFEAIRKNVMQGMDQYSDTDLFTYAVGQQIDGKINAALQAGVEGGGTAHTASALGDIVRLKYRYEAAGKPVPPELSRQLDEAMLRIATTNEQLGLTGQSDEAVNAYKKQVINGVFSGDSTIKGSLAQAALKADNKPALDQIYDQILERADGAAGKVTDEATQAIRGYVEKAPKASGLADFLTSNWQQLLVPAGILGMLFGGNIGKLLGALAVGYGGYNLYDRYKTLNSDVSAIEDPKEKMRVAMAQEAVKQSLMRRDPQTGEIQPFSDIEAAVSDAAAALARPEALAKLGLTPEQAMQLDDATFESWRADALQAVKDAKFATEVGFADRIIDKVGQEANRTVDNLFGRRRAAQ